MSWKLYSELRKNLHPNWKRKILTKLKGKWPAEGVITKGAEGGPEPSNRKGVKCKASGSAASRHKQSKPTKAGVCLPEDATPLFPSDAKGYLHTGVPSKYISKCEGSKYSQLLSTFSSMPKLSRPRVMMFLTARSCVNKRHRSPVTFDNSISGIVLPAIYAIISGGLPLSGANI